MKQASVLFDRPRRGKHPLNEKNRSEIIRRLSQFEEKPHIHDTPQQVIFVTLVRPNWQFGG